MSDEPITISIDADSELGRALDRSNATSTVVLVRNGARFRVVREAGDPWSTYDPERVRDGLRKYAGILTPEEGERIKALIRRGREEGTRPLNRP